MGRHDALADALLQGINVHKNTITDARQALEAG